MLYVLPEPHCTPTLRLGSPAAAGGAPDTPSTIYREVCAFYQSALPFFPLLPSADAIVNTFA